MCRTYFDPTYETTLWVDASSEGLGAVLRQKDIAILSKSLTDTEQQCANIEPEMLAVVYGCERFHTYIHGELFIV